MEWYVPIAILPGISMLILSSTNQMVSVSDELAVLLAKQCTVFQHRIAHLKIGQLSRITRATALLYISAAFFVLAGLIGALVRQGVILDIANYVLIAGVLLVLAALTLLIDYSFKTIHVRKLQHRHSEPADWYADDDTELHENT